VKLKDSRMRTTIVAIKDTGAGSVLFDLNKEEWRELSIKISICIFIYINKKFSRQTNNTQHPPLLQRLDRLSINLFYSIIMHQNFVILY